MHFITAPDIRRALQTLPETTTWPEISSLFVDDGRPVRTDWQLPAVACLAVGGDPAATIPAAAAIACLQSSIILVDDMLDQDPRGEYHRLGYGRTANLALALEAAAIAVLDQTEVPAAYRGPAQAAVARAALATAYGQDLDVQNLQGEANYWRVVRAKSTPFYGATLQVGALMGGASARVAQSLYDAGVLLGEMIQVYDDLLDAFVVPANPDWQEGRNNLALLYAASADHPQREQFCMLLGHIAGAAELREAQQILINSGAVSYCVYLLVQRCRAAQTLVRSLDLTDPGPLLDVLSRQMAPLTEWLRGLGLSLPQEL
jgi:geranylgeranyl pyrophosphate synthase